MSLLKKGRQGELILCEMCLLVESLRKKIRELQEEVTRLCSIQQYEDFTDKMHI